MRLDVFDDYTKPPKPIISADDLRAVCRFLAPCFEFDHAAAALAAEERERMAMMLAQEAE